MSLENKMKFASLSALVALSLSSEDLGASTKYANLGTPKIGYVQKVNDHNFRNVQIAPKDDKDFNKNLIGRIQRTERWANIIRVAEEKAKIPKDTIYAIIMNESYGDILQPNATGDGGIGLIHFQPGTARAYGLEILGHSNKQGRDLRHGKDIKKMLEDCRYDLGCAVEYDDRIHPVIIVDAIVRYLKDGYARKGTWQGAVQTINPGQKSYSRKIFRYRDAIKKLKPLAEKDFNQRNKGKIDGLGHQITYRHYIDTFWQVNDKNFELAKYSSMKRW